MRRVIAGLCVVMSLAVVGATPAGAATATVEGTGSYDKLVVNNAAKKLVFKVFAPGGECAIKYVQREVPRPRRHEIRDGRRLLPRCHMGRQPGPEARHWWTATGSS